MFDTVYSQVGAAISVLILAFAFLKGDEPERIGGGAYLLGWFASLLVQDDSRLHHTQWGLMAVDVLMLSVFAALAWKSRRAWPVWACAFQALTVMSHILTMVDMRPPLASFYVVINLASLGILAALGAGTAQAWRDRRAHGLS